MKDYGEDNDGSDDGDEEDEQDDDAADCDEAGKNGGGYEGSNLVSLGRNTIWAHWSYPIHMLELRIQNWLPNMTAYLVKKRKIEMQENERPEFVL